MFEVPTLEEVIRLAQSQNRTIGIYPETKHPSYFAGIGLAMEGELVKTLHRQGYRGKRAPVIIQSFEVGNLKRLARMTDVPLAQLLSDVGRPWDFTASGDPRTYADMATPAGLAEIARYADGIGANKNLMIPRVAGGFLGTPTALVANAHARGLVVHGWTFRAENAFLPAEYRSSTDPNAYGDLEAEVQRFLELGMDGLFTDQPDIGVRARNAFAGAED